MFNTFCVTPNHEAWGDLFEYIFELRDGDGYIINNVAILKYTDFIFSLSSVLVRAMWS